MMCCTQALIGRFDSICLEICFSWPPGKGSFVDLGLVYQDTATASKFVCLALQAYHTERQANCSGRHVRAMCL